MSTVSSYGTYNFLYMVLVTSGNPLSWPRADLLNLNYVPTCYYDGGFYIGHDQSQAEIIGKLIFAGQRDVPEIGLDVSVNWLGNATLEIQVDVVNNFYINYAPETPAVPEGDDIGVGNHSYVFTTIGTDPESDPLYYQWDWGNGVLSDWLGPFNSGDPADGSYLWPTEGTYQVRAKARDDSELEGPWSDIAEINIIGTIGDANGDGSVNIGDAVNLLNHIFQSGPAPDPIDRGDANCDNSVNIGDAVRLINHVFNDGAAPGC